MLRLEGAGIHPEGSGSRLACSWVCVVDHTRAALCWWRSSSRLGRASTASAQYRLNAPAGLRSAVRRCAMNHQEWRLRPAPQPVSLSGI